MVLAVRPFAAGRSADPDPPLIRPLVVVSPAFERFRFSFFADNNSARDGLDTTALGELTGEERAWAEDMLIDYLPDTRAVIGLGVFLGPARAAGRCPESAGDALSGDGGRPRPARRWQARSPGRDRRAGDHPIVL